MKTVLNVVAVKAQDFQQAVFWGEQWNPTFISQLQGFILLPSFFGFTGGTARSQASPVLLLLISSLVSTSSFVSWSREHSLLGSSSPWLGPKSVVFLLLH